MFPYGSTIKNVYFLDRILMKKLFGFGGNEDKKENKKKDKKEELEIFNSEDEELMGGDVTPSNTPTNEVLNDAMIKKPLPEQVKAAEGVTNESMAEYIAGLSGDYYEEEEMEEEEEQAEAKTETEPAESLPALMESYKDTIDKSAALVVANKEPEKNLALLNNTLSYLPTSIFPYVADSVASTLMDAKDENGKPIFESKNEIIKLLRDFRNSKLRKSSKSGKKTKKQKKGRHERDYMDVMLSKRINPALLITPRMK